MINNRGVAIKYGDVAPEAKENFVPTASKSEFDTLSQLQQYNLNFPNYANPCELYSVVLDGTASAFPSVPEQANLGLWSEQISNDDRTFTVPIVLELESVSQYSSQGLTLTFDTYNGIFATRIGIKWLRITDEGIITLDEKEFMPDSAFYFCRNKVENYNKLVITFYALNMPKNRLKLRVIDYGYGTFFYGDELRSVNLTQSIDPISSEIVINTVDFVLDSKSDMQYSFQNKQPLSIYFNGQLKATSFVSASKQLAQKLWEVQSEDYIGLLENVPFKGGIYANVKAAEILNDIFATANVPYNLDGNFENERVTGFLPYTNCRNALMQVAFAIQGVVDTSESDAVNIYPLENEITQVIPLDRIMQGQSFQNSETVTAVKIVAHTYKKTEEILEVFDATEDGVGENIFVLFEEPLYDLQITNGEIVEWGNNYAIINANENCILIGKKYKHTKTTKKINNPSVLGGQKEKTVSVDNATLISLANIDNVVQKCYNWIAKTKTINLKIVEGKHESNIGVTRYGEAVYGSFVYGGSASNERTLVYDKTTSVGEMISCETEYSGLLTGTIIKQSFNLNGGIIIKNTEMR